MRKFNLLALTFLTATTLSFTAHAGDPTYAEDGNICDRLIKQGASKKEIEICFAEFKKSKYRKFLEKRAKENGERIAATEAEEAELRIKEEEERKKYIIKRFEGEELTYLYSKFVAVKYTDQEMGSDESVDNKMTSPQELCSHLGFDDAVSDKEGIGYSLSERIQDFDSPDYSGIFINWQGKKKEVKWDDSEPSAVKHYTKIVCKRLRKEGESVQTVEMQNAVRLVVEANTKPGSNGGAGEEQNDSERDELQIEVREIRLEHRSTGERSYNRFTHKSKSK